MRSSIVILTATMSILLGSVHAQTLDKGHQILLKRGVQSFALAARTSPVNLNVLKGANFTGLMWSWDGTGFDCSELGPPPGYPWARWASNQSMMPPQPGEEGYMPSLVAISMGDEQNMNDATVRANTAAWYAAVRSAYPNTILCCNNWGGQIGVTELNDYITSSNPDMLSQDVYPWYATSNWAGDSPTYLYSSLQQYRKFGISFGKPTALYTQTYHADSDTPPRRSPSSSEMYLNYFAGVVFGNTMFTCFRYDQGSTALFSSPGNDSAPTQLYSDMTDINQRLQNMSAILTRLTPAAKYISPYEVSVFFIRGKNTDASTFNPTPIDIVDDSTPAGQPSNFSRYIMDQNDPYLRGWTVVNTGTKNNGLPGDVIMAWFKVLDESFDGAATNQIYVMLLNGLCDPTGSPADCHQSITLNYLDGPETQQLLVFNQRTGNVDKMSVPLISTRRKPTFELDGGQMVLYKFNTGAQFVAVNNAAKDWTAFE